MTGQPAFSELLRDGGAPDPAVEALAHYCGLLERWAGVHNLVRVRSRRELVERHVMEALAALPLLGEAGSLVDVGSGAGLPGIPLLAARRGWCGRLVEPRAKRATFLRLAVRELQLDAEVVEERFEALAPAVVDRITARAVGGWSELLDWARGRLGARGAVLLWVTSATEDELRRNPGWCVVSSALPGSRERRLAQLTPCST